MRVAILYPPLLHEGRVPVLTQSRIFSYTHSRQIRIYPLVMAQAATLLKARGHEVAWMDGIAEAGAPQDPASFLEAVGSFAPDVAVLETKVTMIRRHWAFIDELKARWPACRVVLVGDHVSYFPEESLRSSRVDYVVTGGDYDFGIAGLVDRLAAAPAPRPAGDSVALPGGVWRRGVGGNPEVGPGRELAESLDGMPWIDRDLTRWREYGEAYLHRPAAYILSGRGCGGVKRPGRCTFCIWQYAFWKTTARLRDPQDVAAEIEWLVKERGAREIFDDNEAGGMWDLAWMRAFTEALGRRGIAGRVPISSNCRGDAVTNESAELMKRAGYRMLKIALESGNDDTLRRIAKDETVEEIVRGIRIAKDHGLAVMVTTMFGFPWESEADVRRTYRVARDLLLYRAKRGDCLEANVVIPYPGTPLHRYMTDHGWLTIDPADYPAYGMSRPVVSTPTDPVRWGRRFWQLHRHPLFVLRSALSVRSWRDVELGWRGLQSLAGHERDYTPAVTTPIA